MNNDKKNQKGNALLAIFIAVILIGIIIGGYYLWQKSSDNEEMPIQPMGNKDATKEQLSTSPKVSRTQANNGWNKYNNNYFGYIISYPNSFQISDECYDSATGEFVEYSESPKWLVILDRNMDSNFPYCESDFPQMDIAIKSFDREIDINEIMEQSDTDIEDELKIGDNVWARQIMTEPSMFDDTYTTYLFLNKNGKGYEVSIKNTDADGNHDAIIDQIIETLEFN